MPYLLLDLRAFEGEELVAVQNLVAVLFQLENSGSPQQAEAGLLALNEQLETAGDVELERAFDIWLEQILGPRFPEVDVGQIRGREGKTMLAQSLDEWIGDAEQKGRQELVLDLIRERFGPPSEAIIRRLAAITSPEELTRLAARVIQVSSLEKLWAD